MTGFEFPFAARLSLLNPCPINHILNETLSTSSLEGPFWLKLHKVKIEGYFNRSIHHTKRAILPKIPRIIPNVILKYPTKILNLASAQNVPASQVTKKLSIFELYRGSHSIRGDHWRVLLESKIFFQQRLHLLKVVSSVIPKPIFFSCSMICSLGREPGIYKHV